MHCPLCQTEYKDGVASCADCHVLLVTELPEEPDHPMEDLVEVFRTSNPALVSLAQSLLDSEGVPYLLASTPDPFTTSDHVFRVSPVQSELARMLLARLEEPVAEGESVGDEKEPPAE